MLGNRAVGALADRADIESEEQVPHGGITRHHDLVDRRAVAVEIIYAVPEIGEQGSLQEPSRMVAVVLDSCHDVAAAEALRIFEAGGGNLFSGLEVQESEHHGGRSEVERDSVEGAGRPDQGLAIEQDPLTIASDSRLESIVPGFCPAGVFYAHSRAPHRVAADRTGLGLQARAAGQAKFSTEMFFFPAEPGEQIHSLVDLDDAFLALAVFVAGGRHVHAEFF